MTFPDDRIAGCTSELEGASAVVFSPVYCGTSPGRAVARASMTMESYSPYQRTDLSDEGVYYAGEMDVPDDPWKAADAIEPFCAAHIEAGRVPVMLSSSHELAYGAIRAASRILPDLRVIHIGAHAELKTARGELHPSGTTMRRVWELLGDRRIFQFGVRSGSKEEFEWGVPPRIRMERFATRSIDTCAENVAEYPVYITIDMSVVDPGEFCATARPNAGGVSFSALHDTLMSLNALRVAALDICGLMPKLDDATGSSASMVYKVLRETLIAFV